MNVLLVDDDPIYANTLAALLRPLAGKIHIASTFSEAYDVLKDDGFDMVALDLNLPDSTADNTLNSIKKLKHAGKTRRRVVVMSGAVTEFDKLISNQRGADACVDKRDLNFADTLRSLMRVPVV